MKRVCHVFYAYLPRPMGYLYEQVKSIRAYECPVVAEWHIPNPEFADAGPAYRMYRSKNSLRGLYFRGAKRYFHTLFIAHLEEAVVGTEPDLVHGQFGYMAASHLRHIRRRREIPLVVTFYGADASRELAEHPRAYRELFAVADRLIAQGERIAERFVRAGCPEEKLRIWDIGIDLSKFPYAPRRTDEETTRLLTAARFIEKKGLFDLLDAAEDLLCRGKRISLTIIGHGPLQKKIEARAGSGRLAGRVEVLTTGINSPFYPRFQQLLESHHLFVLPARPAADGDEDGLPVVLQNAMARGLPCVSTDLGAIPRLVIDGRTGLLVPPADPASLADALDGLVGDRERWNVLGREGAGRVREKFSLEGQAVKLEKIYAELIGV